MEENKLPFWKIFVIYQKERFPFLFHGPLILMFTFSAISYSRICRSQEGFINVSDFVVGFITTFCLFFLVRIVDEFKDKEIDAKYRKELPVPRGLITLKELKWVGVVVVLIQVAAIGFIHPSMFLFYWIVIAYLSLMTVEFFMHDWLNGHMWAYVGSHMVIIPLVDIYASGLDWYLDNEGPHLGLFFFFGVSYFNGIVLEIGRKLKTPKAEKEGVVTYSGLLGFTKAAYLWMAILTITLTLAAAASYYADLSVISYYVLAAFYLICLFFAFRYSQDPSAKNSKYIEVMSGVWTLLMYGTLGGVAGLVNFLI